MERKGVGSDILVNKTVSKASLIHAIALYNLSISNTLIILSISFIPKVIAFMYHCGIFSFV